MAKTTDGNTPSTWAERSTWSKWGKPRKLLRGVKLRQEAFEDAVGSTRPDGYRQAVRVTLEREPANEHDANAIRALLGEEQIGYIAREVAARLAPLMDQRGLQRFDVPGIVIGGCSRSNREFFACWLWPTKWFGDGLRIYDVLEEGECEPNDETWAWYSAWPDDDTPPPSKTLDSDRVDADLVDVKARDSAREAGRQAVLQFRAREEAQKQDAIQELKQQWLCILFLCVFSVFILWLCEHIPPWIHWNQ